MYAKLSVRNAKRSVKDYLIYFITLTLCVSLFYAVMSLSSPKYELIANAKFDLTKLYKYLKYATYLITAVLIFLVNHVNKYMIKRRKREFATYILLGLEQKKVAFMFFIETLIMGLVSIAAGVVLGSLFSQVLTVLILVTIDSSIVFSFRFYTDTIFITIIFFLIIFSIIGLINIRTLSKIKLIDMFNDDKKTEVEFSRSKWFYIVIAVASVIGFIWGVCNIGKYLELSRIIDIDVSVKNKLLVEILSGIILGIYGLFYSSAYIIIIIKNKFINFKYKNTNLFLIGQLLSKINTTSMLMAAVTLTLFASLMCFTIGPIMSQWATGYLKYSTIFDIQIESVYSDINEIEDIPLIDYTQIYNYINESKFGIEDYCKLEKYFINEKDFYRRRRFKFPVLAVSLSDYNKLRNMAGYESINLDDNEYATQWHYSISIDEIQNCINENSTIKISGKSYNTNLNEYYTESLGGGIYNRYVDYTIILPDKVCEDLLVANVNFYANTNTAMDYEFASSITPFTIKWFRENYKCIYDKYGQVMIREPINIGTKTQRVNDSTTFALVINILGIYGGIILLIICLTILALQQLADSLEHKTRFKILRKMGVDKSETNKLIFKQIGIYFIIPIIISLITCGITLYEFYKKYCNEVSNYIGSSIFKANISISITMIILVFASYFTITYFSFKRNVESY